MLELSKIKTHTDIQARESINVSKVAEYAEHLKEGGEFPAVIVFFDKKEYWLADGWHRYLAHKQSGITQIFEEIRPGSKRDALKYALGANHNHGLPRTNSDKRKAVSIALADKEWSKLTVREIADMCHVGKSFVAELRQSLSTVDKTAPTTCLSAADKNSATPSLEVNRNETDEVLSTADSQPEEELDPKQIFIDSLNAQAEEITALKDRLVAAGVGDQLSSVDEEIKSLRAEIKTLKAEKDAIARSRDDYINQVRELKKQVEMQKKKLTILGGA